MSDKAREHEGPGTHEVGDGLDIATVQFVLKEAKDLIRSLEGTAISRVNIQSGALQIEVERAGGTIITHQEGGGGQGIPPPPPPKDNLMPVKAPLVGVFYRAPSPGEKPFVEVGDTVEQGQQVGIVEAMKVMNEVASDYRGVVVEILVESGEAVQYEQPLMRIDTA
jgi:acetyl-CoA carboxylase biotin carboxyl carrier protein